ncbi:MAG: TatD family hydrolase [Gemmatimonadota bacterium]|nr:TatD family hydrolase [Gemmatimonadota bacterium]MDH5197804.1 TatD family hydrolase [Gemmatimonadota bacterium]
MIVDTHCHLGDAAFDEDRPDVAARARAADVGHVVIVAESAVATERARTLAQTFGWSATAGVHPHEARHWNPSARETVATALADPAVVAVGETGLDYHYDFSPRADQRRAFADHLALGAEFGRPVVVHAREADDDLAAMLRDAGPDGPTVVLHSFSAGPAVFDAGLAVGAYFSFSGMITFKNWRREDLLAACPADRLLVETDAPYLAPVPHRGRRNEPAFVRYVVERLATCRGMPASDLIRVSTDNAARCFGSRVASPSRSHDQRPD